MEANGKSLRTLRCGACTTCRGTPAAPKQQGFNESHHVCLDHNSIAEEDRWQNAAMRYALLAT